MNGFEGLASTDPYLSDLATAVFPRAEAMEKDADNRLLWRMVPRRLEESLRDTLLQLAGRLDPQVGELGYRDMKEYKFKGNHL